MLQRCVALKIVVANGHQSLGTTPLDRMGILFLNRFQRRDSFTTMLLALKWKPLESRRTIARYAI